LLIANIRLPDLELEAILGKHCAKFGTVKFIRLLPVAKDNLHRYVFVQMSTLAETMELAIAVGASTLGSGTVALCLQDRRGRRLRPGPDSPRLMRRRRDDCVSGAGFVVVEETDARNSVTKYRAALPSNASTFVLTRSLRAHAASLTPPYDVGSHRLPASQ
jgi:hypothetical protein